VNDEKYMVPRLVSRYPPSFWLSETQQMQTKGFLKIHGWSGNEWTGNGMGKNR